MTEWIGLLGAAIGALAALAGSYLSERARRQTDRETRWLGDRRVLYGRYLAALSTVQANQSGLRGATQENYERGFQQVTDVWGELQLVAPAKVVDFAHHASDWATDVGIVRKRTSEGVPGRDKQIEDAYWPLLRDMTDHMRRDLDLPPAETLAHIKAEGKPITMYHPKAT